MLMYGISRFVIEFYRGDERGMVFDALSTSQFISLVLVPLSLVMLVWLARQPQPTQERARKVAKRAS
jgi:phosphatidylglycerol:prolipoprotein diacylglycerol transferase